MSQGELLHFLKAAQSAAASLKIKSALNPLLWFCGPVATLCLTLSACLGEPQSTRFFYMAVVLTGAVLLGFAFFAIRKPDYLRSEEYQIQKQSIEMLGDKSRALGATASHVALIVHGTKDDEE